MRTLKRAQLTLFRMAEGARLSQLFSATGWRRRRLLILCYHGVATCDEHLWADWYIAADTLRRRMQLLAEFRCNVLPLAEAVSRLAGGTLPPRSVVITFDDGMHDFFSLGFPIVESFAFPVTLYLTTYYVEMNRPVFDPMCSYLLWKARAQRPLEWPGVLPSPIALDDEGRERAMRLIRQFARAQGLSGRDKDELLGRLAGRLGIDYEELCRRRVLHLISAQEARQLATRGVDIQYHTHRHRVYRARERTWAELDDNRRRIVAYTGRDPRHFCYTSGFFLPEHPTHLRDYGIVSATTCARGLCTQHTDPLRLPRLIDGMGVSEVEFRAWVHGTAGLLPRRARTVGADQLFEDEEQAPAGASIH